MMPPRHAVVALTATSREWDGALRARLSMSYIRALEQAGLVPVIVPPLAAAADAGRVLDVAQGLVLTGGEDVEPWRYGAEPAPTLGDTNPARDACEMALIASARERALPVLAICRGIQVLNVALGGTLIQDIPSDRPGAIDHDAGGDRRSRAHEVAVEPGSRLAAALGATRAVVNSFHHQAVDVPAEALRATAWSPDGLVEGLEAVDPGWWALGVQWHPEELMEAPEPWDRGLFAAFARRCAEPDLGVSSAGASARRRAPGA